MANAEPTPRVFRGDITHIEWSPTCCDRWVVRPAEVQVPSVALNLPGQNWNNARPMIAIGATRLPLALACTAAPVTNTWALWIPYIKGSSETGEPGKGPGPLHVELRAGEEGATSRFARAIWTPNDWRDFGFILQVQGPLATRVEVWAWFELVDGVAIPAQVKFHLILQRSAAVILPPNEDRNQGTTYGPNVTLDNS